MRLSTVSAPALLALLSLAPVARACEPVAASCAPSVSVFPAYTHEGVRIGTVEAPVRRLPPSERSRSTGQPLTVIFNTPGRLPGSVDPEMRLIRLPRVQPFKTQAVYPRGY